ncbi:hypothetical protein [Vibrio coralliilyticus]|uniref:hypothetical protein n=1 Tax=Vibrio coralliilyticus TaxID=190893 RepID=UPI000C16DF91|nr:hypothetical protein [Vibrio coralliilyticus]
MNSRDTVNREQELQQVSASTPPSGSYGDNFTSVRPSQVESAPNIGQKILRIFEGWGTILGVIAVFFGAGIAYKEVIDDIEKLDESVAENKESSNVNAKKLEVLTVNAGKQEVEIRHLQEANSRVFDDIDELNKKYNGLD